MSGPWKARWNLGGSRYGGLAAAEGWYIYNTATGWWSGVRCQVHESRGGAPGPFYTQAEAERHARLANRRFARNNK